MDYLNIVLRGYYNLIDRKYLSEYFFREFKKAEKEHYEADEFFNGCLKVTETFEYELDQQLFGRKQALHLMLNRAKYGLKKIEEGVSESELKKQYDFADNRGFTYKQLCQESITECEEELKKLSRNDFSMHLSSVTRGEHYMEYDEVQYIEEAIIEAREKILLQPEIPGNKKVLSIPTKAKDKEILEFWMRLQRNNEEGEPYWESKQEIEHFVNQNFEGFEGVDEIKEFCPNMNKTEILHVTWTFFNKYGKIKTKRQYVNLLLKNFTKFKHTKNIYPNIADKGNRHLSNLFK